MSKPISDDEATVLRRVFAAVVRRYGTDGSFTILDGELEEELQNFVVEDIEGGVRVHLLPTFIKTGEEPHFEPYVPTTTTTPAITLDPTSLRWEYLKNDTVTYSFNTTVSTDV